MEKRKLNPWRVATTFLVILALLLGGFTASLLEKMEDERLEAQMRIDSRFAIEVVAGRHLIQTVRSENATTQDIKFYVNEFKYAANVLESFVGYEAHPELEKKYPHGYKIMQQYSKYPELDGVNLHSEAADEWIDAFQEMNDILDDVYQEGNNQVSLLQVLEESWFHDEKFQRINELLQCGFHNIPKVTDFDR